MTAVLARLLVAAHDRRHGVPAVDRTDPPLELEIARIGRQIQAFGLAAELDAVNGACHVSMSFNLSVSACAAGSGDMPQLSCMRRPGRARAAHRHPSKRSLPAAARRGILCAFQ